MANSKLTRREVPAGSSDRSFGMVFSVVFLVIALWPLFFSGGARAWAIIISAAFFVSAFVSPRVLSPLNRLWTRFGFLLHRVTSPVVLGILFGTASP